MSINKTLLRSVAGWMAIILTCAPLRSQDDSVEGLYLKAGELMQSGDLQGSADTFARLFDLAAPDLLLEDYGAKAGGFFFDYGNVLLKLNQINDAKEWFQRCMTATKDAEKSAVKSTNGRENLAGFQVGICEAQQGNHEEALRLYELYLNSKPPAQEWEVVRNNFVLAKGSSQIQLGRAAEGIATVQQIFDNRESWRVRPPILMQAIFELGNGWVERASAANGDLILIEQIENEAHQFLDSNLKHIKTTPMRAFAFGFVDRFRALGEKSTKVGLYTLALRFFSECPAMESIKSDLKLNLARLPLGSIRTMADPATGKQIYDMPAMYKTQWDRITQMEAAPLGPDIVVQFLVAECYGKLGNNLVPRGIFWNLAQAYPELPKEQRAQILHEAARYSAAMGDYAAAQYFGEKFFAEMPLDHPLRDNVATFMLQSLFSRGQYETVLEVAATVRERYEPGDIKRELADGLYPMALFSLKRYTDAEASFNEFIKNYPESGNREMVVFHRSQNSIYLRKNREAAEQTEDFLKEFPESEKFGDRALDTLAAARYNLDDYPATIEAAERLKAFKTDSMFMGKTLNVQGDAYIVSTNDLTKDDADKKVEYLQKGLDAYLAASEAAKAATAKFPEHAEFLKNVASEAIWKACDQYITREESENVLKKYDEFFPEFAGTFWEPQISVFALETLEKNGRADEGLKQAEKMILSMGSKPEEEQDLDLLRKAIGSYSEASIRVRGEDATIKTLDNFPGLDPGNLAMQTWLKIQKVIIYQTARDKTGRDTPEFAAYEQKINEVFEDLAKFDRTKFSPFVLQQIGDNFAKSDNPFTALPYYDELLLRQTPDADLFKSSAEFNTGKIEMENPAKVRDARDRFQRVITKYKDPNLVPGAHLNLAKIYFNNKEFSEARDELLVINRSKEMFRADKERRAEAGLLLGKTLEELKDPGAAAAYLSVFSTYNGIPQYAIDAFRNYARLSLADISAMPEGDPIGTQAKRMRQNALYNIYLKHLYMWQELKPERDSPGGALTAVRRELGNYRSDLGIGPEAERAIRFDLGIPDDWNPEVQVN